MIEELDLETCKPPMAPVEMTYQVLERQRKPALPWLAVLRQTAGRRAPLE